MAQNDIWRLSYSSQQLSDAVTNQVPRISSTTGNWEAWDIATSAWIDSGIPAAGKNPYIGNDNYWYVWDSTTDQYVKTDYSASPNSVTSVNGIFSDAGGNVSLTLSDMSGTLPLSNGGTGKTTGQAGLRNLINSCSTLTSSTLAYNDYVPIQDASDSTNAKRITIQNLVNYLWSYGVAGIETGSYVGTGTYGSGNNNSITFTYAPKIIFCGKDQINLGNYIGTSSGVYYMGLILTSQLTTSYQNGFGFGTYITGTSPANLYASKSSDGKTIYWYSSSSANYQNNKSNTTYHWLAIR